MAERRHSRLQPAFRNFLILFDSGYSSISEINETLERCICIMRLLIVFSLSGTIVNILAKIYTVGVIHYLIKAYLLLIWLCLFLLLLDEYLNWKNFFDSCRKIFFCPSIFSVAHTEDERIQTEEYSVCQPSTLPVTTDERSEFHSAEHSESQLVAEQDASEQIAHERTVFYYRTEQQTTFFLFRKYLNLRNIFSLLRNLCCSHNCYSTLTNEDTRDQSEDHAITEEQTGYPSDTNQEQVPYEPDALRVTSEEASTNLQITEQRLLDYPHAITEEQTCYPSDRNQVQVVYKPDVLRGCLTATEKALTELQIIEQWLLVYQHSTTEEQTGYLSDRN